MRKSELWQELHKKFNSLSLQMQRAHEGRQLRAYCDYNHDLFSRRERRLIEHGRLYLLDRPEYWVWRLSDGPGESFRARFETLAARAAAGLDEKPPTDVKLLDFWLGHLFFHFRKRNTRQLFGADDVGTCIPNVCEASAIFCSFLERQALETERRAVRSARKSPANHSKGRRVVKSERRNPRNGWSDDLVKKLRDEAWLRAQKSLSQRQAAQALALSDRSIRNLVHDGKLHKSPKARIAIDSAFWSEYHRTHSVPK
jgi:hypothetical protein